MATPAVDNWLTPRAVEDPPAAHLLRMRAAGAGAFPAGCAAAPSSLDVRVVRAPGRESRISERRSPTWA